MLRSYRCTDRTLPLPAKIPTYNSQTSFRGQPHLPFPRSPPPPAAAVAAAVVKRARPRRALAVLQARFSSYFELLQSAPDPPVPANPTTYPLRSRVYAVILRGLSPYPPSLETLQEYMAKLRSCVFSRNGQTRHLPTSAPPPQPISPWSARSHATRLNVSPCA